MRLSDRGARMIGDFEGWRARPYNDAVGHCTIGYGHLIHFGNCTSADFAKWGTLSHAEGVKLLKRDADRFEKCVNALPVKLNQNQFDSLVSFTFNVGCGGIGPDTGIGRALRRKQWRVAANELLEWNKAGGRVLEGLTRRRREERELFLTPPPVAYSKLERHNLRALGSRDAATRRRARGRLEAQARRIQRQARGERNGWKKHDRGRRYQGIRRRLKG